MAGTDVLSVILCIMVKEIGMETFAERHWDEALAAIPDGTELISVENEVSCRVEMMDIFYHVPGEKGNHYMRAMTKTGKIQAEMITGD